jgi:hypothetical protein
MTQNGQQKNFGLKNLIQDLITTAEMTNHAPTTNLVLLFLPCPPISLNFSREGVLFTHHKGELVEVFQDHSRKEGLSIDRPVLKTTTS